jgi:TonB family protein
MNDEITPLPATSLSETLPPSVTSSLLERHGRQTRLLVVFSALSLVLHLGAFAAYAFWPHAQKPAINLDDAIVKTRLVKLGKKRDDALLPRLPAAPAPPSADKKAPPTLEPDKTNPQPDSSKKPTAAEILEKLKDDQKPSDVRDLIKQRIGEATDEGREDGDKDGVDLEGEIKASYFARVAAHIQKRMEVSSVITDEERVRLRAVLSMSIAEDGTLADVKIQTSSGSTVFDNDVLSAARKSSPVPAPPPPVHALAASGIALNFCPVSCK